MNKEKNTLDKSCKGIICTWLPTVLLQLVLNKRLICYGCGRTIQEIEDAAEKRSPQKVSRG